MPVPPSGDGDSPKRPADRVRSPDDDDPGEGHSDGDRADDEGPEDDGDEWVPA